jgi:hypothetical protein
VQGRDAYSFASLYDLKFNKQDDVLDAIHDYYKRK